MNFLYTGGHLLLLYPAVPDSMGVENVIEQLDRFFG